MKLSHPIAIKSAALVGSAIIKAWFTTLSAKVTYDDPLSNPMMKEPAKLYLFWHEMMLLPASLFGRSGVSVLISEHRDGELIAQVIRLLGLHATRGSTNKHGLTALRKLMRRSKVGHLAITPDGPRGPRRVVSVGSIFLASRVGLQIVPVGFAFGNNWRAKSWDRLALPKPGENARGVFGEPIVVPADLDREGLEACRASVQFALDGCQRRAEALACKASGSDWKTVVALEPILRRKKKAPDELRHTHDGKASSS